MIFVIRARVRERGEDDFTYMYAGSFFPNSTSVGWYRNDKCAETFLNAGIARKYFNKHQTKLLQNPEFSVALDSIEICSVEYTSVERINIL